MPTREETQGRRKKDQMKINLRTIYLLTVGTLAMIGLLHILERLT